MIKREHRNLGLNAEKTGDHGHGKRKWKNFFPNYFPIQKMLSLDSQYLPQLGQQNGNMKKLRKEKEKNPSKIKTECNGYYFLPNIS